MARRTRHLPTAADLIHLLGGLFLRWWLTLGFRLTVRRAAPAPEGAVLYACNHRSFLDPPLVGLCSREPLCYFARSSLWRNPAIAAFLELFRGIPVDRERPLATSVSGAVARLQDGWPVLIFPEGTRTKTGRLGALREGPALIARRAAVAVVPVYIWRSERCWPCGRALPRLAGPRLEIRFGRPLRPPPTLAPRQADRWLTRALAAWLQAQERALFGRVAPSGSGAGCPP
ncbi:MAG: lysophospholipid acyltransferase family protein [Planctomycetota bacterium]|nr:1-acyl-sn-glycerol-3-phosphate acyltransferase [Planctomycetota bacterium]MDW8372486.1 lysophospholipid acyltransferase family protein [Planctomycetota bacterium]